MSYTTTKYADHGFDLIIKGLVEVYDPHTVVELGTQQGNSAIIIGKALGQGVLYTYDSFETNYALPPYAATGADYQKAVGNIYDAGLHEKVFVIKKDAFEVYKDWPEVDILHVDIGNHYDNMAKILEQWRYKVAKVILLEGGGYNHWQKKCDFKPFNLLLNRHFITDNYDHVIISHDENYALTILTRKYDKLI